MEKPTISMEDFERFMTDFTGEHAPCVFNEIADTFGADCTKECQLVSSHCWLNYFLWWKAQRQE